VVFFSLANSYLGKCGDGKCDPKENCTTCYSDCVCGMYKKRGGGREREKEEKKKKKRIEKEEKKKKKRIEKEEKDVTIDYVVAKNLTCPIGLSNLTCSDHGKCDSTSGLCVCAGNYSGSACDTGTWGFFSSFFPLLLSLHPSPFSSSF
jgi:hypothetical protein